MSAEEVKEQVVEASEKVEKPVEPEKKFSMEEMTAFAKAYADTILKAQSAENQQEFVKNYEEQMRSKVMDNQANLMSPNRNNKTPLEYVNYVLERDRRERENNVDGNAYLNRNSANFNIDSKIIAMDEMGSSAEEIAEAIEDIL